MKLKRKTGLKRKQIELLALIYALSKLRGYCSANKSDMARWINTSETDIYEQIKVLENQGFVYRKPEYKSRIYLTEAPIKEFCMKLETSRIDKEEDHLYVNIPYWMFSLTDMEDGEFLIYSTYIEEKKYLQEEKERSEKESWVDNIIS